MELNPAYVSTLHRKHERVKEGSYEFVHKLTIVKLYIVFSCYCNCYFQTWYVEVSDICQTLILSDHAVTMALWVWLYKVCGKQPLPHTKSGAK